MNDMQQLEHLQLLTKMTKQATRHARELQIERHPRVAGERRGDAATAAKLVQ
ncbi:hypothetical protein ABZX28_29110 [Streptomyces rubiginosohelvolus]|uniref:hypothetical protein n=1 Tax=Streptomyces rubiginosohelvolus TaxID=67362 RepID=UPI0033AE869C